MLGSVVSLGILAACSSPGVSSGSASGTQVPPNTALLTQDSALPPQALPSDVASVPPASATAAITVEPNGECNQYEASWTSEASRPDAINVDTLVTGPVVVSVFGRGGQRAQRSVTIGLLDTPYDVEVVGVRPADVARVELSSPAEDGQSASSCIVTHGS